MRVHRGRSTLLHAGQLPDAGNVMKKFQDQVFKRLKGINDVSVMQGNYCFLSVKAKPL